MEGSGCKGQHVETVKSMFRARTNAVFADLGAKDAFRGEGIDTSRAAERQENVVGGKIVRWIKNFMAEKSCLVMDRHKSPRRMIRQGRVHGHCRRLKSIPRMSIEVSITSQVMPISASY